MNRVANPDMRRPVGITMPRLRGLKLTVAMLNRYLQRHVGITMPRLRGLKLDQATFC